jgi:hypothetical protein
VKQSQEITLRKLPALFQAVGAFFKKNLKLKNILKHF